MPTNGKRRAPPAGRTRLLDKKKACDLRHRLFWSALTKKMQEQSLVPQGFAGFLGSIFRFAIRTPSIL